MQLHKYFGLLVVCRWMLCQIAWSLAQWSMFPNWDTCWLWIRGLKCLKINPNLTFRIWNSCFLQTMCPTLNLKGNTYKISTHDFPKGQSISEWIYEVIVSPKRWTKIVKISAFATQGRNLDNFLFIFWEKRWLHKFILKLTDL